MGESSVSYHEYFLYRALGMQVLQDLLWREKGKKISTFGEKEGEKEEKGGGEAFP